MPRTSKKTLHSEAHGPFFISATIALALAAIIAGLYCWNLYMKAPPPLQSSLSEQERIAASLQQVQITTSPEEAHRLADQLSKTKIMTSDTERTRMAQDLQK